MYQEVLEVFNQPGWKHLSEHYAQMLELAEKDIAYNASSAEDFWKLKGRLNCLLEFANLQRVFESHYQTLLEEDDATV